MKSSAYYRVNRGSDQTVRTIILHHKLTQAKKMSTFYIIFSSALPIKNSVKKLSQYQVANKSLLGDKQKKLFSQPQLIYDVTFVHAVQPHDEPDMRPRQIPDAVRRELLTMRCPMRQ